MKNFMYSLLRENGCDQIDECEYYQAQKGSVIMFTFICMDNYEIKTDKIQIDDFGIKIRKIGSMCTETIIIPYHSILRLNVEKHNVKECRCSKCYPLRKLSQS